jgi:para-nitrobenzyl esterase
MASPRAKGLFHRAIGQSGGLFEPLQIAPSYLLSNAERDGAAYASSVGARSVAELRKLPVADLLGGKAASVGHPVIEPYVLPASPYEAFSSGSFNDVPAIVGFNAEEARALVDVSAVKAASFRADIEHSFGALPPPLIDAYPHTSDAQARQARLDFERDLRFGWDLWAWAQLQAKAERSRVYFYYFSQKPPFPSGSVQEGWGASHFAELWYMFDHLDQESWRWSPVDRSLARTMSRYWTNFAKRGDPNGEDLVAWPHFDGGDSVMHLGNSVAVGGLPNVENLRVFDSVYSAVRSAR